VGVRPFWGAGATPLVGVRPFWGAGATPLPEREVSSVFLAFCAA